MSVKPAENQINPAKLLNSKWTAVFPLNKEKHFLVTETIVDEQQRVVACLIQSVLTGSQYEMDWRQLKDRGKWKVGWR